MPPSGAPPRGCTTPPGSSRTGRLPRSTNRSAALEKTILLAPFDGVVAKVRGQLGEWLAPAPATSPTPSVIELIDTGSIYIRAPLDEVDVSRIRTGLPVRVTMDAFPGRSLPGRLTMVGAFVSEAQQQNRTLDVDVELEDAKFARTLLPGISADIEIVLQARDGVLRVPTPTILQGGRVLVVRDDTLIGVKVRAGLANWEYTEVSTVSAGEQIVVSLDRAEVREGRTRSGRSGDNPMIEMRGICPGLPGWRGAVHALRDITSRLTTESMCRSCGPSGSGKSTLLNVIGCLDRRAPARTT